MNTSTIKRCEDAENPRVKMIFNMEELCRVQKDDFFPLKVQSFALRFTMIQSIFGIATIFAFQIVLIHFISVDISVFYIVMFPSLFIVPICSNI